MNFHLKVGLGVAVTAIRRRNDERRSDDNI